jgi:hypothetical protein
MSNSIPSPAHLFTQPEQPQEIARSAADFGGKAYYWKITITPNNTWYRTDPIPGAGIKSGSFIFSSITEVAGGKPHAGDAVMTVCNTVPYDDGSLAIRVSHSWNKWLDAEIRFIVFDL